MKTLYVSQWLFDQLQKQHEVTNRARGLPSSSLTDLPLQVSQFLPIDQRTGDIVQKDPFVTYEKSDMDWAVPLGLAEWDTVPCHCLEVDVPEFRSMAYSPLRHPNVPEVGPRLRMLDLISVAGSRPFVTTFDV